MCKLILLRKYFQCYANYGVVGVAPINRKNMLTLVNSSGDTLTAVSQDPRDSVAASIYNKLALVTNCDPFMLSQI